MSNLHPESTTHDASDPSKDEAAFVQLFIEHERGLRAYLRAMGLNWADADDVVQSVSLIVWKKWDQFDPNTSFEAWLRVIARYEALKFRRSKARDRHNFHGDLMELLAGVASEQEERSRVEDYRKALQGCLSNLPDKSRGLVSAAYDGDQTIKEVAESVGKSATAVYKALNRIRCQLADCVEQRVAEADGAI